VVAQKVAAPTAAPVASTVPWRHRRSVETSQSRTTVLPASTTVGASLLARPRHTNVRSTPRPPGPGTTTDRPTTRAAAGGTTRRYGRRLGPTGARHRRRRPGHDRIAFPQPRWSRRPWRRPDRGGLGRFVVRDWGVSTDRPWCYGSFEAAGPLSPVIRPFVPTPPGAPHVRPARPSVPPRWASLRPPGHVCLNPSAGWFLRPRTPLTSELTSASWEETFFSTKGERDEREHPSVPTGEPIPFPRLRFIPWARYSIAVQEKIERGELSEVA
jgi:hypothetical protein